MQLPGIKTTIIAPFVCRTLPGILQIKPVGQELHSMVFPTPLTICIKHGHGLQPCRRGLTHFGAAAAAASFSSISMGIWNKRRCVIPAGLPQRPAADIRTATAKHVQQQAAVLSRNNVLQSRTA